MKVINVPIEPIEERYSMQWWGWFEKVFKEEQIEFVTVGNNKSISITHGSFLDVFETNSYKTEQLTQIINILKRYDNKEKLVIFFHDLWFPGITNLAYIRNGMGFTNLKICGCLHAGSYDKQDFLYKTGMSPWAEPLENSLFEIIDNIYVATEFHKALIVNRRKVLKESKVIVTGFPMYKNSLPCFESSFKKIIVFPHRLDKEKQPHIFDKLKEEDISDWSYIRSKDVWTDKHNYYRLLSESVIAVSCALQETWGIAMQEAVLYNAIPLCPDRLAYRELYEEDFLYRDIKELKEKIRLYKTWYPKEAMYKQRKSIITKGETAIINMITNMKKL